MWNKNQVFSVNTHFSLHIHRDAQKQRQIEAHLQHVIPVMSLRHRLMKERATAGQCELKEFNEQFSELIPLSVLKQVWAFWGSGGRYSTLLSIYSFTCLIAAGVKSSKGSVAT